MITHEEAVSRLSGMFLQLTAMSGLELLAGFAIISLILSIVRRQDARYERFATDVAGVTPKPAPKSSWALPAVGGLAAAGFILGMGFLNSGVPDIDFKEISTKDYRVSLPEGASEDDDNVMVRRDVSSLNGTFTFFAEQLGSTLEPAAIEAAVRRSIDSVIADIGVDAEPAIPFALGTSQGLDVAFTPEEPDEPTWTEGHVRVIVLGQTLCTLISHGEPGETFAKESQRFMDSLKPNP
ncbi:hypothetical protein EON81_18445 [bacterium]|nr:MAG: hypothetical protein EON81_18445 [bacterium]